MRLGARRWRPRFEPLRARQRLNRTPNSVVSAVPNVVPACEMGCYGFPPATTQLGWHPKAPPRSCLQECRSGSPRRSMRFWSQSSTSSSIHPTLLGPSCIRFGNWPAFSRRAMCCGEYRTSAFTSRFDSILITIAPALGASRCPVGDKPRAMQSYKENDRMRDFWLKRNSLGKVGGHQKNRGRAIAPPLQLLSRTAPQGSPLFPPKGRGRSATLRPRLGLNAQRYKSGHRNLKILSSVH